MPSIGSLNSSHKSHVPAPKKNLRTVFGIGVVFRDSSDTDTQTTETFGRSFLSARKSIDTTRNYSSRRKKNRSDRFGVTDISFFDREPTPTDQQPVIDLTVDDMTAIDTNIPNASTRRPPVRMDNEDGPWSVSVAESPYDPRSYSLYIKTPTHNLTLTRAAMEIVELDQKLRDSYPTVKIPVLPINPDSIPAPPKRKSTFLNTLSRLASPTSGKSQRQSSVGRRFTNASSIPTLTSPPTSPSGEFSDPFTDGTVDQTVVKSPSAMSTAIAAYLTTISNSATLRKDRVWKRFVRVRTDDLESVRVERAIKRVRSDLAAHVGLSKENSYSTSTSLGPGAPGSDGGSIFVEDLDNSVQLDGEVLVSSRTEQEETKEEEEAEPITENALEGEATVDATARIEDGQNDKDLATAGPVDDAATAQDHENVPSATSVSEAPISRMHRSQSADPDKSSRLSRAYTSSVPSQDDASSQVETGDDSSISATTGRRRRRARKKRSASSAPKEPKKSKRKVVIDDFEMMRVLGKGCAGKVLLVKHKPTSGLFALKAITKRHVLAHQELQHTLTEQAVLKRMAAESRDPFVVKLWWSFHDKENLFLVMDFHPGGDLATQLARWGRLGRDRARFYAAEIVEGVEGLHAAGVIYRDLKPENILIGADGHIVLTDFGLSKEFPRRTTTASAPITPSGSRGGDYYSSAPGTPQPANPPWMKPDRTGELALGWPGQAIGHNDSTTTFCGTAEYLAPEVIQGLEYGYEVDWWSFGTMLYEMLTGITPFWANNHSDMYLRVLQDELQFPDDRAIDQDTKSLIRGLLQRNPALRICEPRIKKHPYFSMIDWAHVYYKRYIPPYIPPIDPSNASDTQNFDDTFLEMEPVLDDFNSNDPTTDTDQEPQTDTDRTDGEETNTTPSQSRSSSMRAPLVVAVGTEEEESVDLFDGYSFKGRHSVLIDDEEEEEEEEGSEEGSEEESLEGPVESEVVPVVEATKAEEVVEPKTPEARPNALPEVVEEVIPEEPATSVEPVVAEEEEIVEEFIVKIPEVEGSKSRLSKELPPLGPTELTAPVVPSKDVKGRVTTPPPSKTAPRPQGPATRSRREKSGVHALDRYLSDAVDDTEAERDEEDDDWDFVEAVDGEDRNGTKGTSLFARGVVDRYRLAVFRKASTPTSRSAPRSVSGMSKASEASEATESPSPSQRRGRNAGGLTFRKHPRQFLRPRSPPPSSYSSKTSTTRSASASNVLSAGSTNMLTASPSFGSTLPVSPSLKSKQSATSMGAQSISSDQSGSGASPAIPVDNGRRDVKETSSPSTTQEKFKTKKLKRYKNNAEKVFSLFSSPRQS